MESTLKYIIVIGLLMFCFALLQQFMNDSFYTDIHYSTEIAKYAKINTLYRGVYNDRLRNSVKQYCLDTVVSSDIYGRLKTKPSSWFTYFNAWYKQNCYDPDGLILEGINAAMNDYDAEIQEATESDREPRFTTDKQFDFHNVPKYLWFNDYCPLQTLADSIAKDFEEN